ncbi:MAG: DNA primase [Bacteroidetes bacterium]|nr:DNA primase [Bacteroidota bacterium]
MISQPTIARIFDTARIEEVVGDFLTLKKRGVNYIACCPFHNEKTPSFNVNPVRNIYKCFGCGKGGDSVSFVMEHEKLTYPEALRYLAKKYNIEIEELYDRNIEEEKKQETERESLYVVCSYAQKYFTDSLLNSDEGKSIGLSYFKERGLSDEIIHKFQLGYSPEKRTAFTDSAIKEGYNLDYLVKAGLTIRPEGELPSPTGEGQGVRSFDRYSARVIFPIHNITGRVIGFGGRALRKEAKAKYINSPETEIYHKSNVLYGMAFARKTISTEDNCYLVEGYMDVTSMHQAGIENVVASSGTSLTVEQIRLIKRYTNNITIMYDGDSAGIKASFRGIDMVLEEGLNVRAVLFPEGDDPDSYSRKHSESETKNFIKANTTDFIRFKTQLLFSDTDNDPIKKATLIQQIVESIALIPNSITRTVFIQECSKIMKMDEQALLTELNKALRKRYSKGSNEQYIEETINLDNPPVPQPVDSDRDSSELHEKEVIRLLLTYGNQILEIKSETEETEEETPAEIHKVSIAQFISEHLATDSIRFENELYQKIFIEYSSAILTGEVPALDHFVHHENSEISHLAIDLTTFPYTISDWLKKHGIQVAREEDSLKVAVEHAIYSLKIKIIMKMISETQKQLQETTSEEEIMILIAKKKQLDEAKNIFSKELGWVVLR